MEVDTDEGLRRTILEDVGIGLGQERQTGSEQFVRLRGEIILVVDMRLRHIMHLMATLIDRVVASLILQENLLITVVGQLGVQTILQHGKGGIGITHAVDGLSQVEPDGGIAIEQDVSRRGLVGVDIDGVGTLATTDQRGTGIAEGLVLHNPVEGRHLHLLGKVIVLGTAGRVAIDL